MTIPDGCVSEATKVSKTNNTKAIVLAIKSTVIARIVANLKEN